MNLTPAVTLGLALLTVVALSAVGAVLVIAVLARASEPLRGILDSIEDAAAADGIRLAWLVALIATAGSLYMSEVAHFEPCLLCWYQRIAMYPLVLVLGMGALRNDLSVVRYALPLAIVGAPISLYHYTIETFPDLAGSIACDPRNPCTLVWFRELGFVTLPLMAFAAFALISTLLLVTRAGRSAADAASNHSLTNEVRP